MSKKELRIFYKSTHDSLIDQRIKNDSLIKRTNVLKNEIKYNSNSHNKIVDSLKTIQFVNDQKSDSLINLLNDKNDDLVNSENYQKLLLDSLNNLLVRFSFEVDSLENINFVLKNDQIRLRDSVDFLSVSFNNKFKGSSRNSYWKVKEIIGELSDQGITIEDKESALILNYYEPSITVCSNEGGFKFTDEGIIMGVLYTEVKKYKNVIRVKFKSLDKDKVEHGKDQFDEWRLTINDNTIRLNLYGINGKKANGYIIFEKVSKNPCLDRVIIN